MAYTRLSVLEREEISRFLAADPALSWTSIAGCTDRHRGTVQREVDRNGGRHAYRAGAAHARAVRLRPCRSAMLITDRDLAERIAARVRTGYSPAGTARLVGGVCTETIYAGIYSGVLEVKAPALDPEPRLEVHQVIARGGAGSQDRCGRGDAHRLGQVDRIDGRCVREEPEVLVLVTAVHVP